MGITARGAWISVRRHFAEMGIDIQSQPARVVGCGDMSGDVFGNGMLLSKAIKLVAAFDHRHIFLDPDPDPAASWSERQRLFALPRSSWDDYDKTLISRGGGVFPRSQKAIPLSSQIKALLGVADDELDPASLVRALLKSPADLLWFGGIGTFIKASSQNQVEVGDPANDALRVDAAELRARVIGEGANLAVTQAGRIEFALAGGRINTDFIDNSAGVDCSDHEVNIKIPLNREMAEARLTPARRNKLLADMTDEVAELVLEDNRLQTLALSIAERGGASALPPLVRAIEVLEESGRLNRRVEGLAGNQELLRRAQDNQGLTRPELAVLLSTAKLALQGAIEASALPDDPVLEDELAAYFPPKMRRRYGAAIAQHSLRREILATGIANRLVNRLGILAPFAMTEEQGASWAQAATAFVAAERLFDMAALWNDIDRLDCVEEVRLALFEQAAAGLQLHISDLMRSADPSVLAGELVAHLRPGLKKLDATREHLLRAEPRKQTDALSQMLTALGAPRPIVDRVARLFKLDGAIGIAALGRQLRSDEIRLTKAYTRLGEALGLDWAQSAASRLSPRDPWERLVAASLGRDFEQLRLDFLARAGRADPEAVVEKWLEGQTARIDQFRRLVQRARTASTTTLAMLSEIAAQARVLLAR
jgi:glutamate dehydrogenase